MSASLISIARPGVQILIVSGWNLKTTRKYGGDRYRYSVLRFSSSKFLSKAHEAERRGALAVAEQ